MRDYKIGIFDKFKMSNDEMQFLSGLNDTTHPRIQVHSKINDFFLSKQIEKLSEELVTQIESSERSNKKSQDRMFWLTVAIFFTGFIQAVNTIINLIK